ncbi:QueT transporter family protein [Halococcus sp. IIIV-5B]|uniref:QueT transporter family protein n=1 Tax=Halococcus sp. IIIV-5B TaxID=2321230 RepID=UPI001F17C0CC|nr:QueT transporter family protein [Halococcus sp. IIIV-5B]
MREAFTMWRDTRMIMLVAVVAAVYAAILIPFKAFQIIPGFVSVRPANVFPVIFGLMFGPAAAWGSAIGNLIGDIFGGTLSPGSIFGFIGNFFYGMIGYKLWGSLGPLSSGNEPNFRTNTGKQLAEYVVIAAVASALTASTIAWGLDTLGLAPFPAISVSIGINNFLTSAILGPILLFLLWGRVKDLGLLYPDVMRNEDLPNVSSSRTQLAAVGLLVVAFVWIAVGTFVAPPGSTVQLVLGAVGLVLAFAFAAISGERLSSIVS